MALGQCKDTSITFVNATGMAIVIPKEGHTVKNPGGLEGSNKMELGTALNLDPGEDADVTRDLSIKCVRDAEFRIVYSGDGDRDYNQTFRNVDIRDGRRATLRLTNN
jgi:hypothetical protein